MESDRQKLFKQKIKNYSKAASKKKTRDQNKHPPYSAKARSVNRSPSKSLPVTANEEVTILGSRSYHDQNKSLSILQNVAKENTEEVRGKENSIIKAKENIGKNNNIIQQEDDFKENIEDENADKMTTGQDIACTHNNLDLTYKNNNKYNIIEQEITNTADTPTDSSIVQHELSEKQKTSGKESQHNEVKFESDENVYEIEVVIEKEISMEGNAENEEPITADKETEFGVNNSEELHQNREYESRADDSHINNLQNKTDGPDQLTAEISDSQQRKEAVPNQEKETEQNEDIEKRQENENDERLTPTITDIIPEKEMDIMRKSLEEENEDEIDIPNFSDKEKNRSAMKNKRRATVKNSYLEFLSEEEDFVWDSTSWKESEDESTSSELDNPKKKRKQPKKRSQEGKVGEDGLKKKKINKRRQKKELKNRGKQYTKRDGSIVKEKQVQENPCIAKKCGHKCGEITEERRKHIFDHFWSLTAERKKDWVVAMTSRKDIKRKRAKDSAYRINTFDYFINDGEGRRQVCSQFLIKTLDVTQRFIHYTVSNASMGLAKIDSRGKIVPTNKTPETVKTSAKNFIKDLPALPSHYCRKDSTRLYLPVEFKSIKNLYRLYKKNRTAQGVDVVSEKIFREIFTEEFNLGFHVPKKDKCLKCLKYQGQENQNEEMIDHLAEKEAAKNRLNCHRELPKKNPSILCTSFDLQKVLNTPYGDSMLLFYSRKYTVYNLCFYESVSRKGFCYIWGETEGKRGGNEISSILQKYIDHVDERKSIKHLILYSDSCPGQNKNKIVLSALHNALLRSKHLETLQMNYLLPGHTEMTVDSIHSTIENSVRNTIIWAPSQWVTVCQMARKEPEPYIVEGLTHEEFKNYEEYSDKYFKGNLTGKISKIRVAMFKKSTPNVMTVKYSMKDDAQEEQIPIFAKPKQLNRKYKSALPITKSKYNDLKKLCDTGVIPRILHSEYFNFNTHSGKDSLVETDIEDETEERE